MMCVYTVNVANNGSMTEVRKTALRMAASETDVWTC